VDKFYADIKNIGLTNIGLTAQPGEYFLYVLMHCKNAYKEAVWLS
jgi:hypothetical protein